MSQLTIGRPAVTPMPFSVAHPAFEIKMTIFDLQDTCGQPQCERMLERTRDLLAALPLTTDEHARATCSVANVQRYLASGERGAAIYELRLLAGTVAGWGN